MADEHDLVSEVAKLPLLPQNRFCADCDAESPDWASLNLGILLCIKCAGVHRNLGVHLSKVRSLHLDTDCWDRNQLDFMLAMGNERAKEIYEANCPCWYLRPTVEQESSIVRENFIRAKYERKEFLADMPSVATSIMPESPKEGYLWKANKKNTWQKRYTVLHGRFLNYFKAPSDSYPKGILDVCELTFKLPSGPDQNKRYVFEAHTSKRVYPFGAESWAEMIEWVHTLKRAAAYYITILGSDMADEAGMHMLTSSDKDIIKVSFQQLSSPAKMGYLCKQGGKWKSWNKRLCVVTDDTLFYFKKDKPSPSDLPEGGIALQNCFVSHGDSKAGKAFCISLMTPGRVFFLCAYSEVEREEWQKVLKEVCEKKTPRRLVDFSQMDMPEPIRSQLDTNDDDSD